MPSIQAAMTVQLVVCIVTCVDWLLSLPLGNDNNDYATVPSLHDCILVNNNNNWNIFVADNIIKPDFTIIIII